MPTIAFTKKDLENLVGEQLSIDEVRHLAHQAKGDMDDYNEKTDEVKIDFGDTNLPYLWSVEGFARFVRAYLGKSKGIPEIKIHSGTYKIIVDKSVAKIRPFIAGFAAKGNKIDDYFLRQLVQLQEKLAENYGRRRQKLSIGVYSYQRINFPIYYRAVKPDTVSFVPLEFSQPLTLAKILEQHPKGKDYGFTLKDFDKYPILVDETGQVLSFVPIINSNFTGKVEVGDDTIFFEVTGTDENHVQLAATIFAYALSERGFQIHSAEIIYPDTTINTPQIIPKEITVHKESILKLYGLNLKDTEIKKLLVRAQYNCVHIKNNLITVEIPPYRGDFMHEVDIVEDIGIMYGYDTIPELPLTTFTKGATAKQVKNIDKVRELMVGLGFQEVLSPMLTNKKALYDAMNISDRGTVEIAEYMSESYSVVRSWILPQLFELMCKNKHVAFPQKIFEEGIVSVRTGEPITDFNHIAIALTHEKTDFTEGKQVLDYLFSALGISYTLDETEQGSFITGRVGSIIVNGKKIGYLGEIHPQVLSNWGLEMPVAAMELNLSELFAERNG